MDRDVESLRTGHAPLDAPQQRYAAVIATCAIALTAFSAVLFLWWLRRVLVPLTFAVFLAFLCEPILSLLVKAPERLAEAVARRTQHSGGSLPRGQALLLAASGHEDPPAAAARPGAPAADAPEGEGAGQEQGGRRGKFLAWLQQIWDIVAVLFCGMVLIGVLAGIIFGVVRVCIHFDWSVYHNSPKLAQVEELLKSLGIMPKDQSFDLAALWRTFESYIMDAASTVLDATENVLLTSLIFLFCLFAMLPGIHDEGNRSRVQGLVQKYLICKTLASLIIAALVALALYIMQVPLVPFFGVLTFFLNFIPNIGSLVAVLAPVPLVWLDPDSSALHVALVVLVQFAVHNVAGNIIEPQIMSSGLDLHPLTVIVALTFWGSIWDIPGTILSVPMSCALRLLLAELDHPFAKMLHAAFTSPLGGSSGAGRRRRGGRPQPAAPAQLGGPGGPAEADPGAAGAEAEGSRAVEERAEA